MTADELARSYFLRARKRMLALQTLMHAEAYPDVVREAQELVELTLEGMLRWIGFDRAAAQLAMDEAQRVLEALRHFPEPTLE